MNQLAIRDEILATSLEEVVTKYDLVLTRENNLVCLNYNMIASEKDVEEVKECRGLILDEANDYSVVAYPFRRFFNHGEGCVDCVDFSTASIQEKLDGCCDESTIVITENGKKTIKEICETTEDKTVLAYNHETSNIEYDKIVGRSIKTRLNDWYEIELETGEKLKLTGNHRVWCENLQCYRQVKNLSGKEILTIIQ